MIPESQSIGLASIFVIGRTFAMGCSSAGYSSNVPVFLCTQVGQFLTNIAMRSLGTQVKIFLISAQVLSLPLCRTRW